jgi:putative redox protein
MTAEIHYVGNLRTEMRHTRSGSVVQTDAPTDNKGRGEAFSPTDLVAAAYVSCMFTIIGIHCEENDITFCSAVASVNKQMSQHPRRIGKLEISIDFSGNGWTPEQADKMLRIGRACPVARSLHPEVEIEIQYQL